jgi:hypothetical protein
MKRLVSLLGAFALLGCSGAEPQNHASGVYILLDTSGTYTQEIEKAQQIVSYTLSQLEPGDSFAIARIDTGSFSEKDIIAKVTFDDRPSTANGQKRKFLQAVQDFVNEVRPAQYTDISGGLLQAVEYLSEKNPSHKTILIFSDMKEDLDAGYVRNVPLTLQGVDVVAVNVTKLRSDNLDPREYLDRLNDWQHKVESGGGNWRVINDLDRLDQLFRAS